jgi:hypothetical protein
MSYEEITIRSQNKAETVIQWVKLIFADQLLLVYRISNMQIE